MNILFKITLRALFAWRGSYDAYTCTWCTYSFLFLDTLVTKQCIFIGKFIPIYSFKGKWYVVGWRWGQKRGSFPLIGWTSIFMREMRSKRELSLLKRGKLDMHGHTLFEIFKKLVVMSKKSQVILMYWLFYICSLVVLKYRHWSHHVTVTPIKMGVGGADHSLWNCHQYIKCWRLFFSGFLWHIKVNSRK